jgi:peptidoglycan/LPS O-acetylase OafA/YrhL
MRLKMVKAAKPTTYRFMELEGLRGIASIIVVIYHNLLAFYAIAFLGIGGAIVQHSRLETTLYGSPILGLLSGTFAVAIFFVLSGFVLSIAYFKTRKPEIVTRMAIKRYPRLMLPVLVSTLLCYALIKLGLSHTQSAATVTDSAWLHSRWNFIPDIWNALWSGTVDIFTSGSSVYNNVLWTMKIEFLGSFLVFAFLLLFSHSHRRWLLYALLVVLTFNSWLLGFVFGMMLADVYAAGYIKKKKRNIFATIALMGVAIILGGYPYAAVNGTFYHITNILPFITMNYQIISTLIGATIIVVIVLTTKQVADVLSHRHISIFGKYTFSIYLIHLPILYTFTTGVFLLLHAHFSYTISVVISFLLSIPLLILATILFEKYIDVPAIKLGSKLAYLYHDNAKKNFPRLLKEKVMHTYRLVRHK